MRFGRARSIPRLIFVAFAIISAGRQASDAAAVRDIELKALVSRTVRPMMAHYGIPGMAVGLTVDGRHYVFDYGIASKASTLPVDGKTLFEIGSISKTFTASVVSYARLSGKLALTDSVGADFPSLGGTSFDRIRLIDLGTHTAGGLPLQFPDDVHTASDALDYYRRWKPSHPPGTYRLYSNPSIMLLGLIAAKRMNADFIPLMQRELFGPLGLEDTFLVVPKDQMSRYAQGFTDSGRPRRMLSGPLAAEAYGIRTTAIDLLRFVDANLGELRLDGTLRRAIIATHTGYYQIGPMTQDLMWEQTRYPIPLSTLLHANSAGMLFEENRASAISPPLRPGTDVLIDKTGSTDGFSAYVAFVPQRRMGIVLLANKSYPIAARVAAAYHILMQLK